MARLFDDRERYAESIYVHDEEQRFLAHRRAIEHLAVWAAECMQMDAEATAAYEREIVDAFVAGTPETTLLAAVQTKLERAGKPALSTTAGTMFAQAVAEATQALRGGATRDPGNGQRGTRPYAAW